MNRKEEKQIGKFYKSCLAQEIRDPEVVRAKKQLIETYFPKDPFLFPFGWAVPAAGFIAICLLVYPVYLSVHQSWSKSQGAPEVSAPAIRQTSVPDEAEIEKVAEIQIKAASPSVAASVTTLPPVMVKSVGSDTGQVMIYKQKRPENPITVIWVFPGGK